MLKHKIIVYHVFLFFLDFFLLMSTVLELPCNLRGKKYSVITDQNTDGSERILRCLTWCSILPQLLVEALIALLGQEKIYCPGIAKDFVVLEGSFTFLVNLTFIIL